MRFKKKHLIVVAGLCLFASQDCSSQQLFKSVTRKRVNSSSTSIPAAIPPPLIPMLADATAAPTVTKTDVLAAEQDQTVTIAGTNFDSKSEVKFGGIKAKSVIVLNDTTIKAIVGAGGTGQINVTNAFGNVDFPGFNFVVAAPSITGINPITAAANETITITGVNLGGVTAVTIGGKAAKSFNVSSPASITVIVDNGNSGDVEVTNTVGTNSFPGFVFKDEDPQESTPGASADFTIPDVGQSNLNIIVTPSFMLNKVYYDKRVAFSGAFWGNSFGMDSARQRVGNKFLLPQTSMIGFKLEGVYSLADKIASTQFGIAAELNLLFKKISFFDTTAKSSTNISPFVIHPKIGAILSCFNGNVFFSAHYNFLAVQTQNDQFIEFFKTEKKTFFAYPEFNVSGIFDVSDNSKQSVKVAFDLIVNNSDAKIISNSTDKLIPYLKIGFVSKF